MRPRTGAAAAFRLVINVDLKASVPQTIISMVTKKIAGAVLANLIREAQRVATWPSSQQPSVWWSRLRVQWAAHLSVALQVAHGCQRGWLLQHSSGGQLVVLLVALALAP